jgi:hypothetical protein
MICAIQWNTQSIDGWEEKFSRIPRSNILQSYTYALAACPLEKQRARWGLIEIDGHEAGLVQIFEAGILWNRIHAVMIDRGPLWFDGFGNAMHVKCFFDELNRQFPQRWGRKRRILPETEDGPTAQKMIAQTGLQFFGKGYETIWLDLSPDEETLRANMKSNWRNKLSKAERAGLDLEWDATGTHLPWLTGIYAADKAARDYGGPSAELLRRYGPLLAAKGDLLVGRALRDKDPVAFVLLVRHGRSATYLAGWSSPEGRESAAHHLLLWEGACMLKQNGIRELDLGGINDDSAEGIKIFKEGLGGRNVRYVGHYR